MPKLNIKEVFARNLSDAMDRSGLKQQVVADRAGGMSQGHISEMLKGETDVRIGTVQNLADALGIQAWELLAESDSAKMAALAKLLWGGRVPDATVEQHYPLPPAPPKEVAPKPKKAGRGRQRKGPPSADAGDRA